MTKNNQIESLIKFVTLERSCESQVKIAILNHDFDISLNEPINCLTVILLITVEKKSGEITKFYSFLSYKKNKHSARNGFTYFPFKSNSDAKIDITDSSFIVNGNQFGTVIGLNLETFLGEFSQIVIGTFSQEIKVPSMIGKYLREFNLIINTLNSCNNASNKRQMMNVLKEFFITTINALNNKFYYSLANSSPKSPTEKTNKTFYKCRSNEKKAWITKIN